MPTDAARRHLLSIEGPGPSGPGAGARPHRFIRRGEPAPHPPECRPCGARRWCGCSTRTAPAPGCRSRPQPSSCRPTTVNFSVGSSSVNKGESVRDTVQTIGAMGIDAIVVRHSCAGVPHRVAEWIDASVINAGDGRHEHPTQALLDLYTARTRLGGLDGARVAIVGDILHSRVARSDVLAFTAMGADVTLVAPRPLLPSSLEGWPVTVTHDFDSVLGDIDICYLLRMQLEREAGASVPSLREFRAEYGLDAARADRLREGALIMHPGPHEPRRGDRRGRRRPAQCRDHRTGRQRGGGPHGGPVPAARLGHGPGRGRKDDGGMSTRLAAVPPSRHRRHKGRDRGGLRRRPPRRRAGRGRTGDRGRSRRRGGRPRAGRFRLRGGSGARRSARPPAPARPGGRRDRRDRRPRRRLGRGSPP